LLARFFIGVFRGNAGEIHILIQHVHQPLRRQRLRRNRAIEAYVEAGSRRNNFPDEILLFASLLLARHLHELRVLGIVFLDHRFQVFFQDPAQAQFFFFRWDLLVRRSRQQSQLGFDIRLPFRFGRRSVVEIRLACSLPASAVQLEFDVFSLFLDKSDFGRRSCAYRGSIAAQRFPHFLAVDGTAFVNLDIDSILVGGHIHQNHNMPAFEVFPQICVTLPPGPTHQQQKRQGP
jgi:hypothetical protein